MSLVAGVGAPTFKIGVDGGGTKTELILVDAAGTTVARLTVAGCNPSHTGAERAGETVRTALAQLVARSDPAARDAAIVTTHLYMAGAPAFWAEFAATLTGCGRVIAAPDALPVLELATGGAAGLALHAGTGSFVAARAPDGFVHFAGGLGWKLGDPGSGFDLARRAIAHALLELQGWAPASGLGAALQAHTGLADAGAITRSFYGDAGANSRLAAFAPRVVELAQEGCQPAQTALAATLTELVAQARRVTEKLFPGLVVPCGVSGAVLTNHAAVFALKALAATHQWSVDYNFITEPPIEGVRRLLAKV